MKYYCSAFAPFTEIHKKRILEIIAEKNEVTLIFVNDELPEIATRFYMKAIMEELGQELSYQQISAEEFMTYVTNPNAIIDGLLPVVEQGQATVDSIDVKHGYENTAFSEHLIFDDISETMARYLVKNEMFSISKNMVLVFNSMGYKRFKHTMRVAYMMRKLATIHGFDEELCFFTALFHDYAKEMPEAEQSAIMEAYFPLYTDAPKAVWHGFAGSLMLQRLYEEVDTDIVEAIAFHPIGLPQLTELGLALYIADFSEFGRPFKAEAEHVWELAQTSLYVAARQKILYIQTFFEKSDKKLYWTTENMLSWLNDILE